MIYKNIVKGIFLGRPNRFIAVIDSEGEEVKAHVKNTGRLGELLTKGAEVYLEDHAGRMGKRKMRYSLIGVRKGARIVNIDSQAPNKVFEEALRNGMALPKFGRAVYVKPEAKHGESRLDFYIENEEGRGGYVEVKGVTLEENKRVLFPDAPTERGIKHLKELEELSEKGFSAYIVFVIQMEGTKAFSPNRERHLAFAEELERARDAGVGVLAYECEVGEDYIMLKDEIEVQMS